MYSMDACWTYVCLEDDWWTYMSFEDVCWTELCALKMCDGFVFVVPVGCYYVDTCWTSVHGSSRMIARLVCV